MRRHGVLAIFLLITLLLAGCTSSNAATNDKEAKTVVENYYGLTEEVENREDVDNYIDAISNITHSASPLPETYQALAEGEATLTITDYDNVETRIIDENIGKDRIKQDFYLADRIPDEALTEIAKTNRVVEAEVSGGSWAIEPEIDAPLDENDTTEWLVSVENGEWVLVS
jgi:hypothetical protein